MALTASDILDSFPEFVDVLQPVKDMYLELATCQTSQCAFGCAYEYAIALRAAHNLVLLNDQGSHGGGAVTSKTEGELSEKYMQGVMNARGYTNLETTNYGRMLQDLINGSVITPRLSGVENGC